MSRVAIQWKRQPDGDFKAIGVWFATPKALQSRVLPGVGIQNHGYLLADAASRNHLSETIAIQQTPAAIPYPYLMDEATVKTRLADSRKRRLLGRGRWLDYVFER